MDRADFDRALRRRPTLPSRGTLQTALGGALIAVAGVNAWLGDQTTAAVALTMGVGNVLAATSLFDRSADGGARTGRNPVIAVTDDGPPESESRPAVRDGHRPADD